MLKSWEPEMRFVLLMILMLLLAPTESFGQSLEKEKNSLRIATYNAALNRKKAGDLVKEMESDRASQSNAIAEVIQRVRPDVLLINEVDHDKDFKAIDLLLSEYLAKPQNGAKAIEYKYKYAGPVNTGVDSGIDLDGDGNKKTPNDAFGYGVFPGQYGMVVLSKYEIDVDNVRRFQKFLWKDMPNNLMPKKPESKESFYSDEAKEIFRLSSKSHWDVPIKVGDKTIHFLVCHPTPPVFDGPEDKNGRRNHDEIRIWSDYVKNKADYLYDDAGEKGGLKPGSHFVIAGDLNCDPHDGDSREGAIQQLLNNPQVEAVDPKSTGGKFWAEAQGGKNEKHKGNPAFDTGDWNDKGDRGTGNLRVDYVLPSKTLKINGSGVFWPKEDEPGYKASKRSDHRLVWIDIEK